VDQIFKFIPHRFAIFSVPTLSLRSLKSAILCCRKWWTLFSCVFLLFLCAGTSKNGTAFGLQMSQAGFSTHIVEVSLYVHQSGSAFKYCHVNALTCFPLSKYRSTPVDFSIVETLPLFHPACIHINLHSVSLLKCACVICDSKVSCRYKHI